MEKRVHLKLISLCNYIKYSNEMDEFNSIVTGNIEDDKMFFFLFIYFSL